MAVRADQDICWLDVAMYYTLTVSIMEGFGNFLYQAKRGTKRQNMIFPIHELLQ